MIIQETPTLNLQFDKAKNDSDMLSLLKSQGGTFTRVAEVVGSGDSVASYFDALGILRYAKLGHPRPNFEAGVNQGLLIEEARTNLLERSEEFDNAYWTKSNATITANNTIAPNGELTADKIITGNGLNNGHVNKALSKSGVATTYTFSLFAKKGEWDRCLLYVNDTSSFSNRVQFFADLENGTVVQATVSGTFSSPSASVEPIGNGYYFISVTFTTSTETSITARIYSSYSDATLGDGTSGIFIWGAQLEEGSFPTSYIPTAGETVTRGADNASITGTAFTDFYNQNEGTFVGSFIYREINSSVALYRNLVSAIRVNSRGLFIYVNYSSKKVEVRTRNNDGFSDAALSGNLIDGQKYNFAVSYNINLGTLKVTVNGSAVNTLSSVIRWDIPTLINLSSEVWGAADSNLQYLNSSKSRIIYFPKALPDADLQLLTRI